MKISLLLFFMLFGFSYAQQSKWLTLTVCDTIPDNLYSNRNLKQLSIHNSLGYCISPVKVLSAEIAKLQSLESLNFISNYTFAPLPPEIKLLQNLTYLGTTDIIPEIAELTNLKSLNLIISSEQELEDLKLLSFEKLTNLEFLYIHFNGGVKISEESKILNGFEGLTKLKHLHIFQANLKVLAAIPTLENLTTMSLNGVSGKELLDFTRFPNIDTLSITRAPDLKAIPGSVYQLQNLVKLSITSSAIEAIEEGVSNLKNLKHLELNHNKIMSLPSDFNSLNSLEVLSLGRNFNLRKLPENIGDLINLKRIAVNSCQLSTLPESITQLKNLEALICNVNDLTSLPADWSEMKYLKVLNFERNKIETLPASLLKIESLERLELGFNCLLGEIFANKQLPIGGLTSLIKLDLMYNDLLELPYDIGKLKNLEELNIYHNNIKFLPESIGGLGRIENLSMSQNQISSLPKSMKKMRIYEFSLHGNAFTDYKSMAKHFPKARRVWVDEAFEKDVRFWPRLGWEVYYR